MPGVYTVCSLNTFIRSTIITLQEICNESLQGIGLSQVFFVLGGNEILSPKPGMSKGKEF